MKTGTYFCKNSLLRFSAALLFCAAVLSLLPASAFAQCGWNGKNDFVCQGGATGAINTPIFSTIPNGYTGTPTGPGVPINVGNLLDQIQNANNVSPNLQNIAQQIEQLVQTVRMVEFQVMMDKLSAAPPQGCPGLIPLAAQIISTYADQLSSQLSNAESLPVAAQEALTMASFATNPLANAAVATYVYPSPNHNSVTVLGQTVSIPASSC